MRQFFSLLVLPLLSWWWFFLVHGLQRSTADNIPQQFVTGLPHEHANCQIHSVLICCRAESLPSMVPVQTLHPASVTIGSTCENGNLLIFPPGNILWGDYGASTKFFKNVLTFVRRHHRLTLLLCFFPRDATPSPSIITTRITALEHASQGPCGR